MSAPTLDRPIPAEPIDRALENAIDGAVTAFVGAPDEVCRVLAWQLFLTLRARRTFGHIAQLETERMARVRG